MSTTLLLILFILLIVCAILFLQIHINQTQTSTQAKSQYAYKKSDFPKRNISRIYGSKEELEKIGIKKKTLFERLILSPWRKQKNLFKNDKKDNLQNQQENCNQQMLYQQTFDHKLQEQNIRNFKPDSNKQFEGGRRLLVPQH